MAVKSLPAEHDEAQLSAERCRDPEALRDFVQSAIGPNAWPIHSRPLRRAIESRGLDLGRVRGFTLESEAVETLTGRFARWGARVERWLGVDLAYHHLLHNFEVTQRLLLLEWPGGEPPAELVTAAESTYRDTSEIRPAIGRLVRRLRDAGVSDAVVARDLLAGLGHDYGHSGGTDRVDARGVPTPLTHEETAERHVAKFGLDVGFPVEIVLQAMAGIRATTFHRRPDRDPIQASNDFERKITLADVAGCVLPPASWLTHVSVPVLREKLPAWRRRRGELPRELEEVRRERDAAGEAGDDEAVERLGARLEALEQERKQIIDDIPEVFRGERGFLLFIRDFRLRPVDEGVALWADNIARKVDLIDEILSMEDDLRALEQQGFPLLERYAEALSGGDLHAFLDRDDVDPHLRNVLEKFVASHD